MRCAPPALFGNTFLLLQNSRHDSQQPSTGITAVLPVKNAAVTVRLHILRLAADRLSIIVGKKGGTVEKPGRLCFLIPVADKAVLPLGQFLQAAVIRAVPAAGLCDLKKAVGSGLGCPPICGSKSPPPSAAAP